MRIGELARRAHVTRDTIRFYERRGLLGRIPREGRSSAYKDYGEGVLERLHRIRYLKGLGYRLSEIGEAIEPWMRGSVDAATKQTHLRTKLERVRAEAQELALVERALEDELARLSGSPRTRFRDSIESTR